jgi:dolichyl-phosphate-mannose-protein mannosyltransferase
MAIDTGAVTAHADPATGAARTGRGRSQIAAMLLVPLLLMAVAGTLRFYRVEQPDRIYFDEVYYVDDARDLIARGVEQGFAVHPPVGKWLIGAGIWVFGDSSFGWRAASAAAGTLTVLMVYLAGLRLFRRRGVAALAALLLAVDGLAFTMSRIAMLDAMLTLFIATGFWLLLADRDRLWEGIDEADVADPERPLPRRPHARRWLAGIAFGLALATKWSAVLAIGAAGVFVLVAEYAWRRKLVGTIWRAWWRPLGSVALTLVVAPAVVYVASYTSWFVNVEHSRVAERLCDGEDCRYSVPDLARAWGGEQAEILRFHRELQAEHPYRASPRTWLVMSRPVAYYYESCPAERAAGGDCVVAPGNAAEIVGMGNPALWWLTLAAYPLLWWFAISRHDWRAWTLLAFVAFQYLPWLATARPAFLFYMTPVVPFMALALAYAAWRTAQRSALLRWVPSAVAALAVGAFLFWYPVWSALEISRPAWQLRMWFGSWI